jgi:hypothetical protein
MWLEYEKPLPMPFLSAQPYFKRVPSTNERDRKNEPAESGQPEQVMRVGVFLQSPSFKGIHNAGILITNDINTTTYIIKQTALNKEHLICYLGRLKACQFATRHCRWSCFPHNGLKFDTRYA